MARPATHYSLTSWVISTPYRGGFFLTGAGVDGLLPVGKQADRMSKMAFLLVLAGTESHPVVRFWLLTRREWKVESMGSVLIRCCKLGLVIRRDEEGLEVWQEGRGFRTDDLNFGRG